MEGEIYTFLYEGSAYGKFSPGDLVVKTFEPYLNINIDDTVRLTLNGNHLCDGKITSNEIKYSYNILNICVPESVFWELCSMRIWEKDSSKKITIDTIKTEEPWTIEAPTLKKGFKLFSEKVIEVSNPFYNWHFSN